MKRGLWVGVLSLIVTYILTAAVSALFGLGFRLFLDEFDIPSLVLDLVIWVCLFSIVFSLLEGLLVGTQGRSIPKKETPKSWTQLLGRVDPEEGDGTENDS
jgi:hypothetical protein